MSNDYCPQSLFNDGCDDSNSVKYNWKPTEDEIRFALELNTINSFRTNFRRFRTKYASFRQIYDATGDDLACFTDWAESWRKKFLAKRDELQIGQEFSMIPDYVKILTYFDSDYPHKLREIYDPPPVLYVRGNCSYNYDLSMAIVGTRNMSDYGRMATEKFAFQLSSWGFTIISGGARGIDSVAHRSAIQANGKTIAVLGCGLDVAFPAENVDLFHKIAETGAVISEFPMGTIPEKYNFPARNRIIAGLSRGTIVIEAPEKSGALITVDLALQDNREIFAIPGKLTDGRSKGTNKLIQDGAHIALDPSDIPLVFGLTIMEGRDSEQDDTNLVLEGDEALVYNIIHLEPRETDEIVRELGIPAYRILSSLLVLQTRGLIKELPGSRFVRPVLPNRKKKSD